MKPLEAGELRYAGRKINPETCKFPVKDLRRLVGRCGDCGRVLRGSAAIPHPDPFQSDVFDDDTPVVQCEECAGERATDV